MANNSFEHSSAKNVGGFRAVCVSSSSFTIVQASLEAMGFRTYILESQHVHDKETFIQALATCFDFEYSGRPVWDAASDLMWQSLIAQPNNRAAVLWKDCGSMIENDLQLFLDGFELLCMLGHSIERQELTSDCHPILLRIVVFGEGKSFVRWDAGPTAIDN
jgi:hypothetical protein